jgi:2-amino-4-hydroxy-6-hydroxymethyldihydropteridine diphosphokinase
MEEGWVGVSYPHAQLYDEHHPTPKPLPIKGRGGYATSVPHLYAIAIGSNRPHGRFGRPSGVVEAAIARLDQEFGLFNASPTILNPALGHAGRDFANTVALVESDFAPPDMLRRLKAIERDFGRRSGRRWGPRVLDLDLVLWSGGSFHSRRLTIPHPQLETRSFVLQPLAAIAPGWRIRGSLTAGHLAHRLARRAAGG